MSRSVLSLSALRVLGVVVAATAVATGCTTNGSPQPSPSAAGEAQAAVDLAALDTGSYPTEPREPFGRATDAEIVQVEAQRMAQFIVVPFEVDGDLTNQKMPTQTIASRKNLTMILGPEAVDVPANEFLLGGYTTTASTPDSHLRAGTARSLNNMVVRYADANHARAAARQMADALATRDKTELTGLPGEPTAIVKRSSIGGNEQMLAFTPHNSYVLYQWVETTPEQQDLLDPTLRTALGLQRALIDQFPATPTKAEAAERGITDSVRPYVDQDRVLIYALPMTDEELETGGTFGPGHQLRAVYGPRGRAHTSTDPKTTFTVLTETGSTANAVERSIVYRAATPDGATAIMEADGGAGDASTPIDPPPGLPAAACTKSIGQGTLYSCHVQEGRYVGYVRSDDVTDAYQQISAQYVILTKADQNA
ncbi:hypothetical protein V1Y59_19600 [Gordonia sp. PKS22-38]|uniref:Uncharacterized protein n=1 Tax=Gordonia prachuapensis TaxID=3115651 RepID=A0ABU7MZW3_9ACTN|nr:hypothetical protein [Gordonia sp. PKS22-38]